MLLAYNNKCKYRLPMKRLYGNNADEDIDENEDENVESIQAEA